MLEYLKTVRLVLHGHNFQLPARQSADRNFTFHHATHSAQAKRVQSLRTILTMITALDTRLRG